MKHIFKGVCTALVTPFDKDNKIDFAAFKKLIEFQLGGGVDALLVLGTTGEASTISMEEKKQIVEAARKQIKRRVPLIVGIGGNNPSAIIEFGLWLKSRKVDGVLLSAPYYNKATQNGLVKFFGSIAKKIRLPMIVYNVPGRTGVNIEPKTYACLAKIRYISGIKEASGSIQQIAEVIRVCPNITVYAGDDNITLPAYALGVQGVISVASNIAPTVVADIYRKVMVGNLTGARVGFMEALPMFKILFCEVNPIPVKYALNCMGLIENVLRLPLTPLDKKYQTEVKKIVD